MRLKKSKPVKDDYVIVVWADAHAVTHTWTPVEELDDDDCLVTSIGLLLPDVKSGHLVLAQSMIHGEETVDNVLAVPLGMVRTVRRVSCGEPVSLP